MRLMIVSPGQLGWQREAGPDPSLGEVRRRTRLSAISVSSGLSVVDGAAHGVASPQALGSQTPGVVEERGADVSPPLGTRVATTAGQVALSTHRDDRLIPVPEHTANRGRRQVPCWRPVPTGGHWPWLSGLPRPPRRAVCPTTAST